MHPTPRERRDFKSEISVAELVMATVRCDMKLHSVLLGGAILTKPCVCPQVLHGGMRLMGGPGVGATVRGMKPSR
jgi:hypothetical protein